MKRQAVITGLGIVSPIGIGVERFWAAARAGRSGIGTPTLFDASKLPRECQIVGEVTDFDVKQWMPGAAGRMAGRFSQFAVAAAKMAREDAHLDTAHIPSERIKVSIGTSMNGLTDVHQPNFATFLDRGFVSPWACLEYPAHAATSHVAIESQARGQATSFATACAAGLDAVAWAAQQLLWPERLKRRSPDARLWRFTQLEFFLDGKVPRKKPADRLTNCVMALSSPRGRRWS